MKSLFVAETQERSFEPGQKVLYLSKLISWRPNTSDFTKFFGKLLRWITWLKTLTGEKDSFKSHEHVKSILPLTDAQKIISAFLTSDGFYQYNVMAFGLRNAHSTFQRLANKLVQGLEGCAVYLEDLVIFTETWPEHVQTLTGLFARLEAENLKVNLTKSEIGWATLNYLGLEVGRGQFKPLEAKVNAMLNYPIPKTRKDLRRYLGMVSFQRSFFSNLSETQAHLIDLTSPNSTFHWNSVSRGFR